MRVVRLRLRLLEHRLVRGSDLLIQRIHLRGGDHALVHEARAPHLTRRRVRLHLLVEQRLRVRRLVALVVAPAPVPDEVHEEILSEPRAVRHGDPHRDHARLRIVRVHVDDRHLEALGHVARVPRRARVDGIRGETDLVVHDQMQRAAHAVPAEAREIERLRHDPLAREGGVAVDADRHDRAFVARGTVLRIALPRASRALQHRIHDLQVAWVRHQRHAHFAGRRLARALEAEMVLHVAGRGAAEVTVPSLELAEDQRERLPQHVREHADAATVRHRDRDALRARRDRRVDGRVQHGHECVRTLDREALVAHEGAAEEAFESVHLGEAAQHRGLLFRRERPRELLLGEELPEPHPLFFTAQMPDFDGKVPRVALLEPLRDVTRGGEVREAQRRTSDLVEVGVRDAVELRRQLLRARRRRAQRVELHRKVAVGADRGRVLGRAGHDAGKVGATRRSARRRRAHRLLGEAEELAPRLFDGRGILTEFLELLGGVGVVEDARDRLLRHA